VSADDAVTAGFARGLAAGVTTFGFAAGADYRLRDYAGSRDRSRFTLVHRDGALGTIDLPVPGRHNAKNAAAAAAMATELGVPFAAIERALHSFGGVARRFQFRGERNGVTFVDDYAHLPGEVAPMIDAAHEGNWSRVIVVFQPHRYTRTAALWRDFAHAFDGADTVVLTDVYAADEAPQPGVSGRLILRAVLDARPDLHVVYLPQRADVVEHVPKIARAGDLVLTLGAGDLTSVPDEWLGAR
jgi:UDP-N-acetylmuramate--alanine ligase